MTLPTVKNGTVAGSVFHIEFKAGLRSFSSSEPTAPQCAPSVGSGSQDSRATPSVLEARANIHRSLGCGWVLLWGIVGRDGQNMSRFVIIKLL